MRDNPAPYVLEKGTLALIKTLLFDFYMFIQLLLFYLVCYTLGVIFTWVDKLTRPRRKLTDSLSAFFEFVGNL